MTILIATDLDGTLLNNQHEISQHTQSVLKSLLAKKEYSLVFATGRHYADIHYWISALGGNIAAITSNGASIHDFTGESIQISPIDPTILKSLLAVSARYNIHTNLYTSEQWLVERPNTYLLQKHLCSGFTYEVLPSFGVVNQDVIKVYFWGETKALLALHDQLEAQFPSEIHLCFSDEHYLEVMSVNVNKGSGLEYLIKQQNIVSEQIFAFGDAPNDIQMLQLSDHALVPENASLSLTRNLKAYTRINSNHEDGVAQYINRIIND